MNEEENEVVYPTVTEETKHLGAQLIDSLTLGEQPPETTPPTDGESDTTSTTPDASKDAVEQTVEEPTAFGEGFKKSWQETNQFNPKDPRTWSQIPSAAGAGVTDFGIDLVNKIPNADYITEDKKIAPQKRSEMKASMEALIHHFKILAPQFLCCTH